MEEEHTHEVSVGAAQFTELSASREKRSCWQCYKLHWSDASLTAEGHEDKVFCSTKCLTKFQDKEAAKEAKKKAIADKVALASEGSSSSPKAASSPGPASP